MQAWVIAKISIVWVVFISRIRCAIKAGIRSVAEQKLKQSKLMLSGFFPFLLSRMISVLWWGRFEQPLLQGSIPLLLLNPVSF